MYGKADDFDYSRYGYNSDTIKAVVVQEYMFQPEGMTLNPSAYIVKAMFAGGFF